VHLGSALIILTALDTGSFGFLRTSLSGENVPKSFVTHLSKFRTAVSALDNTQYRFLATIGIADLDSSYPFSPNSYLLLGLRGSTYYGPLRLQRYQDFLSLDKNGGGDAHLSLDPPDCSLDLACARYLTISNTLRHKISIVERPLQNRSRNKDLGKIAPDLELIENLQALPRFRFVERVVGDSKDTVLRTIKTSVLSNGEKYDPRTTALVEEDVQIVPLKQGSRATFKLLADENERLAFTTKTDDRRFFVISDQYYPGWTCTIDGTPTKIIRTNYAVRGIVVPPGEHQLEMVFKPKSFAVGLSITMLVIVVDVVVAFFYYSAKKRRVNRALWSQA
jgi:hypothetical protein